MNEDCDRAQSFARELLVPSFVCDFGWFGGHPILRFSNKNFPNEVWLGMSGGFQVTPSPVLSETLTSRQRDLLLLESTYGYEVKSIRCYPNSRLEVLFTNETLLTALDDDADQYECWEMRTDPGGLIVASPGGGYAIWPSATTRAV